MDERPLVFVPERGFMPARALGTPANVVVERAGLTFTGGVAPDRDGVRVTFTVTGIHAEVPPRTSTACPLPIKGSARVADDRGREVRPRPRWITGPSLRGSGDGVATLQWVLMLEAPEPDARCLDLSFDGPAGDWKVALPLEEVETAGLPATRVDAVQTSGGIALAARAVARTTDLTVVELEAFFDPPPPDGWPRPSVRGIGKALHAGRLCGDQVVLRDGSGDVHLERGRPVDEPTGGKRREAINFGGLSQRVRAGTVEVDVVWVDDGFEDSVTVPVPAEASITIGGCDGRVTVSRVPVENDRSYHWMETKPTTAVRVEVTPADPEAERQLVCCTPLESRVGMTVSHCFGKLPTVEVPEIEGPLDTVTFRGATLQVRGPWRLEIPLD